jgi:hypothetical protein
LIRFLRKLFDRVLELLFLHRQGEAQLMLTAGLLVGHSLTVSSFRNASHGSLVLERV